MDVSVRSYLTAGAAAFGACAIALTPVQPVQNDPAMLAPAVVSELAVDLAAAVTPVDPLQAIVDVFTGAGANIVTVFDNWANGIYVDGSFAGSASLLEKGYATGGTLPIIQQVIRNVAVYLGELPDIGGIAGQVFNNVGNAFREPFQPGASPEGINQNVNAIPYFPLGLGDASQRQIASLLPILLGPDYEALEPIVNFATTPISGLLLGTIGPIVAPVLSVVNSISNTIALIQESKIIEALTELVNIPTNAIGAFLNGGPTLDLTGVVGALGITLPDIVDSIGLKMGGVLSPGGVAFDSLATKAGIPGLLEVEVPGLPVGPSAMLNLGNYIATAIKVTPAPMQQAQALASSAAAEAPTAKMETEEAAPELSVQESAEEPAVGPVETEEAAPELSVQESAEEPAVGPVETADAASEASVAVSAEAAPSPSNQRATRRASR